MKKIACGLAMLLIFSACAAFYAAEEDSLTRFPPIPDGIAKPLSASDDAALALQDFVYFPDFQFNTDEACEQEFRFPGPEVVKRHFGTPDSVDEGIDFIQMYYPFGWVLLEGGQEAYGSIEVLIDTDGLEGPRGLRVGDPVEAVLATFSPDGEALPLRSDIEGEIELFVVEADEGAPMQYGYATYLGGRLATIDYGVGSDDQPTCTVSFEVGGGTISQIRWRIFTY